MENIDVNFVCLSPDSSVWAYNYPGFLYKYDENSDSFQLIYSTGNYYESNIGINHIFFEDNNTVYIATIRGVLRLNMETMEVVNCPVMNRINVNHINKESELFYFSTTSGLYVVREPWTDKSEIIGHLLQDQFINRSCYDTRHQQFWLGTFSNGIYVLPKRPGASPYQAVSTITKPVRSIIPYNETQFAVGIDGEGIVLINRRTMDIENVFVHIENDPFSLRGNSIYDLMLDKQKTLWVCTYHTGIAYMDRSYLEFRSFTHIKGNTNSISTDYVNTVFEDKDGDIWFGTNDGLNLYYRNEEKWKHFFLQPNSVNKNSILTLNEDANGKMWAGGYAFALTEIDKRNGVVKRHRSDSENPITGTNNIYAIYTDEYSGDMWTGGIYGPVSCFNFKTGQLRSFKSWSMRCFSSYNDSVIVLGTTTGLLLLNKNTGEEYRTRLDKMSINAILKDGEHSYWIATMGKGLFYYDIKKDSLYNYTPANGLSSNHVYGIEKDEKGNLWLSTEEGLNKLHPATGTVVRFTKKDGLISNQFLPNSSFRCSTGEIIFGSADGAVIFNPSEIEKNKAASYYPLIFTEFSIFGVPVVPGAKESPLSKPINKTDKIVLPHNKNYFSLTFTSPNYQSSYKTGYSYFLEGYDIDWSKISSSNTASYSKLPPGKYEFILRSYIERQFQEERRLLIIVNQPWWNTTVAWIIYVLIVLASVYAALRYYAERQKKKQTEEKIDFFINTAHDILTPLNLIEAPLKDISMKESFSTEVQYLLSLALNNCQKLSHFIHQLIDFQRIMLNAEKLVVRKNNLREFFIYKKNTYQIIAAQKFISLYFHLPEMKEDIYFDKEKLNKIIDNLLSNAIKYTPFGGTVEVKVVLSDNSWSFMVKDTGIGISKRNQHFIFKHIFRADNDVNSQNVGSGAGLKMVHALVKIHQGRISFVSKEGEGTEFTVIFPYKYDDEYIDTSSDFSSAIEFTNPNQQIGNRILIVEPEIEMSDYLSNSFTRNNNKVAAFKTGSEAFNQLSKFDPELIIVDSLLSDMDIYSFCEKIKGNSNTLHIPLIIIMDGIDDTRIKKILSAGATDYIKKPFEFEVLNLKVLNLLSFQQNSQNKTLADIKKSNVTALNNSRDQEFVDNLILFIEKNLDNPKLNIAMICNEFALSRTLLYNRITQLTNNSPNEFIRIVRLKNAANLLLSSKYSVAEVATMVGFESPKHFSYTFKEYYKVSPKDFGK